jgi:osmoprotectant transport system permease protein
VGRLGRIDNGQMLMPLRQLAVLLCLACGFTAATAAEPVAVGSKRFTESYVLGELVQQTLQGAGVKALHRPGLGNTAILDQALASGQIDVYPEYTGTIVRELLKREGDGAANPPLAQLNEWLKPRGLKVAVPLGFNNTYALAMREADAQRLGIDSISALAKLGAAAAPALRFGLSHEFLVRADGWPALKKAYALPFMPGSGLDHGLAYEALANGQVDIIDVYSTDAKIGRMKLRVLRDDRNFFPRYDAVLLMRATLDEKPLVAALQGRLDEATMIGLNAQVEIDGRSFAEVARGFLTSAQATTAESAPRSSFWQRLFAPDLGRLLLQHLALVLGSVVLAVLVGVPLGVWAYKHPAWSGAVMAVVGVLQTVPSLALLAFLIVALGRIGFVPTLMTAAVFTPANNTGIARGNSTRRKAWPARKPKASAARRNSLGTSDKPACVLRTTGNKA